MRYYVATALIVLLSTSAAKAQPASEINLRATHSEIVRLSRPAVTLIVGDPTIADVTAIGDPISTVLFTAKNLGTTNFVALDSDHAEVYRAVINVGRSVTVSAAGSVIHSYVCNPNCSPGTGNKEATVSSLPAGSTVTMPVGGGQPGP